jgi:hypothetical protein
MNTALTFPFSSIISFDSVLKPVQMEDVAIGDDHKIFPVLEILRTAVAGVVGDGFLKDVEPILNDFVNWIAE